MKLSITMLNFLGYVHAECDGWCSTSDPAAFTGYFGEKAILTNKLMTPGNRILKGRVDPIGNAMGLGLPAVYPGYILTETGKKLGEIGARMRDAFTARNGIWIEWKNDPECQAFIDEGQKILNAEKNNES